MPVEENLPRVCLITGSSRGIGREFAQLLSENGNKVYASMRHPKGRNLRQATEIGKWASVLALDVTDPQTVQAAVAETKRRKGCINIVVNNAGYVINGPVQEMSVKDAQRQFDTHAFGPLRVIGAVTPLTRRQGSGVFWAPK